MKKIFFAFCLLLAQNVFAVADAGVTENNTGSPTFTARPGQEVLL